MLVDTVPDHPLHAVARSFEQFDVPDVLAKLASLQLIPENAGRASRIELAACAAAAASTSAGRPVIRVNELRRILAGPQISCGQAIMQEDPIGGWFVESVSFVGGAFLVLPGITTSATFTQRHLGAALALAPKRFRDSSFAQEGKELCSAVLALSHEIVQRARLQRGVAVPAPPDNDQILIPKAEHLRALAESVRFTAPQLAAVLRRYGVSPQSLAPLTIKAGQLAVDRCDLWSCPLQATPIVQFGDDLIVGGPSLLLPALRHRIICMARAADALDDLVTHTNSAVWNCAVQCLRRMRIVQCAGQYPGSRPDFVLQDGLFEFDADKAMYVCLVGDDLAEYDPDNVFGAAPEREYWPSLRTHLDAVFSSLASSPVAPNELLCLLLLNGFGRMWGFGVGQRDEDPPYEILPMAVPDLEIITHIEQPDPLLLWKFARAGRRVRAQAEMLSIGMLNEFGCYRDREYSFYLTDRSRPTAISLGCDWEGKLQQEALERTDGHGVLSYDRRHVAHVTLLHSSRDVPIYINDEKGPTRVALVVEGYAIPVWIVGPDHGASSEGADLLQLADLVAYWLWQFLPSLKGWFDRHIGGRFEVLVIHIAADQPLNVRFETLRPDDAETPFTIEADPDVGDLRVGFHPTISSLFYGPDNTGEKEFMTALLQTMKRLVHPAYQAELTDRDIDAIVTQHASVPTKKKMIITDGTREPEIDPRGLPYERLISPADENDLLDELGEHLRVTCGLKQGTIPRERRTEILNAAVGFYFQELARLVRSISPVGLTEWLVSHHEALIRSTAFWKLVLPTRLACFEREDALCSRWAEEHAELSKTAIGLRFAIEYVTACPPSGIRRMSYSVQDRLVALACEIIQVGFQSDVIHYDLDGEAALSVLPSGRLGRQFNNYETAVRTFMRTYAAADIAKSAERFTRRWTHATHTTESAAAVELREATREEFGHSMQDIGTVLAEAGSIALETSPGVLRIPRSRLIERIAQGLRWKEEKVDNIVSRMSLEKRADFLSPPPPFAREEVYPWRYTRQYSYLRRPFLHVRAAGVSEIIIGPRHLHLAWRYLCHLCLGGRLPAQSPRMKTLVGRINRQAGEEFNDTVADNLETLPGVVVRRRLKKTRVLKGNLAPPGDIDVLVADRPHRRMLIIECKDLAIARTPREMAQQLQDVFDGGIGKASTMEKHLRRTEWARTHLRQLLAELGLGWSKKWRVEPLVVFDDRPMSASLTQSPMRVMGLRDLLEYVSE